MSSLQVIRQREDQNPVESPHGAAGFGEKPRMHPEDFRAHLAWVAAKEVYETGLKKNFTRNPGYTRFVE